MKIEYKWEKWIWIKYKNKFLQMQANPTKEAHLKHQEDNQQPPQDPAGERQSPGREHPPGEENSQNY